MTTISNRPLCAALTQETRAALLVNLSLEQADVLYRDWHFWAREEQRPPQGDWRIWLFTGGRGAGKTRAGAEWILDGVHRGAFARVALVGATYADVRDVMIGGESGLLNLGREEGLSYAPSKRQLHWPNGAIAQIFTAEEPDGLRGHQHEGAWGDGLADVDYVLTFLASFSDGQIEPVEVQIPVRRSI